MRKFQFKNMVEATAKVLALQNDRQRYFQETLSTADTIRNIIHLSSLRDAYMNVVRYLTHEQLRKDYHTMEYKHWCEVCRREIAECENALNDCNMKFFRDKLSSCTNHPTLLHQGEDGMPVV